jgi:phosphoadenosine phosphosulfate reductase
MPLAAAPDSIALAAALDAEFRPLRPAERLALLRWRVPGRIVFTTSFGIEDQAITHLIAEAGLAIELATLDTGRLFPETHALWAETERRYGLKIRACHPDAAALESLVAETGIDGFYHRPEWRKSCCAVRKMAPLGHALAGAAAWTAGLRADQSDHRRAVTFVGYDAVHNLIKANPLLDHSREDIATFTATHGIPVNPLHGRGFLSIGCAPCTRPVSPGEPERSGRWWWETGERKECGLHVAPDGRLTRLRASEGSTP